MSKASVSDLRVLLSPSLSSLRTALTETQVRAQLHLEEEQKLVDGGESLHATTPSAFIMHGLDLEETQYVILL